MMWRGKLFRRRGLKMAIVVKDIITGAGATGTLWREVQLLRSGPISDTWYFLFCFLFLGTFLALLRAGSGVELGVGRSAS